MQFPSLWALNATATKGLLKKQGLLREEDRGSWRVRAWGGGGGGSERGTKRGQAVKLKSWYHSQKPSRLQPTSPSSPVTDLDSKKNGPAHLIAFHTSKPSSGFVPVVFPPARPTSVGSQSEMWMSSRFTVPGCFSNGLATNPTPRTPPSHSDHFLPRRGQLLPPDSVWPPLSETTTGAKGMKIICRYWNNVQNFPESGFHICSGSNVTLWKFGFWMLIVHQPNILYFQQTCGKPWKWI